LAAGILSGACGGATKYQADADPPVGGTSGNQAGSSDGPAKGGSSAGTGGGGTGGTSSSGGILGMGGSGDTLGTGGERPCVSVGGSGGNGQPFTTLSCDEEVGGPRPDGPAPLIGPCEAIPDEVLVARSQSSQERTPRGLFFDSERWKGLLLEPCASYPEQMSERGGSVGLVGLPVLFTTPWFYEGSFCGIGPGESARSLRCDYFQDGVLADPTPENLAFLASIFWWHENRKKAGTALIGYSVANGDASDWVELCTVRPTRANDAGGGDLRLERTRHSIFQDGTVSLGQPELVRPIHTCR
jgi:hypothetical protein